MDHNVSSDPFAGLGRNLLSATAGQEALPRSPRDAVAASRPRKARTAPRRRGPVSREVAFHLARAERISRERSALELFVDGMADMVADLHAEGRLPLVQTHDGPLPGRSKP